MPRALRALVIRATAGDLPWLLLLFWLLLQRIYSHAASSPLSYNRG